MPQSISPSLVLSIGLVLASGAAEARGHRARVVVSPSPDAIELDALAPPARRGTVEQTYGDAAYARARAQARTEPASEPQRYPCDPRVATNGGYLCPQVSPTLGYGQFHAFTPAYVSAPQTFAVPDSDAQSPLLAPVTSLFWSVNSARWDRHD